MMLRRLLFVLAALLALAPAARAQMLQAIVDDRATAAAPYSGPADVVASPLVFYGLRGVSAAYATPGTNPAIDYSCAGGSPATGTIAILSTGKLDVATLSANCGANVIKVTKLYDQSGNASHASQATGAKQPVVTLSCIGSLPCITFDASAVQNLQSAAISAQAQPFSATLGYKQLALANTVGIGIGSGANPAFGQGVGNNTTADFFNGTGVNPAATNNAFHALVGVYNGVSSTQAVDGATTSSNPGTVGISNSWCVGGFGGSCIANSWNLSAPFLEAGVWAGSFSGGNITSMNSNIHAYWGF